MTPKLSGGALVGALMLAASFSLGIFGSGANATTFHNGDVALYNFDLTGQTPSPPYNSVGINFVFNGATVAATGTFDFFDALNGGGSLVSHIVSGIPTASINFSAFGAPAAGILDGIFSIRLAAAGDTFEVVDVSAQGFNAAGVATPLIPGELVTPLPATLPLFAGGLGALGLLGWRRKKKPEAAA